MSGWLLCGLGVEGGGLGGDGVPVVGGEVVAIFYLVLKSIGDFLSFGNTDN